MQEYTTSLAPCGLKIKNSPSLDFSSSLSSYDFAAQVTLQIDRLQGNSKHLPGHEVMDFSGFFHVFVDCKMPLVMHRAANVRSAFEEIDR